MVNHDHPYTQPREAEQWDAAYKLRSEMEVSFLSCQGVYLHVLSASARKRKKGKEKGLNLEAR